MKCVPAQPATDMMQKINIRNQATFLICSSLLMENPMPRFGLEPGFESYRTSPTKVGSTTSTRQRPHSPRPFLPTAPAGIPGTRESGSGHEARRDYLSALLPSAPWPDRARRRGRGGGVVVSGRNLTAAGCGSGALALLPPGLCGLRNSFEFPDEGLSIQSLHGLQNLMAKRGESLEGTNPGWGPFKLALRILK